LNVTWGMARPCMNQSPDARRLVVGRQDCQGGGEFTDGKGWMVRMRRFGLAFPAVEKS
jgi:hypothetical protein